MLTWLVEKAPELVLHISLALLQVLLLEAREWEEVTQDSHVDKLRLTAH
jgi:hypothetical protein